MGAAPRLFADDDPVLAIGAWRNNGELIADVARLGYLDGSVLDATFGEGKFWTEYRPEVLVTNDLHKPADLRVDFRALPFPADTFDAVAFDPPYRLSGRRDLGEFDDRYGTDKGKTTAEVLDDLCSGAVECYRVARRHLLVKCQDQTANGRRQRQADLVTRAVKEAGGGKLERFDLIHTPRPQRSQKTARSNSSQLLVFDKAVA
jgi:hypothetical protein